MNLKEVSKDRNNNLDLIRFIAATMVLICHASPIAEGKQAIDLLATVTYGQMSFGNLAVLIFFFYAGFLITKSIQNNGGGKKFWYARIIRIFPELVIVIFLSAFIMGPIISRLEWREYFTNSETYKYLLNSFMILTHNLPGVFEDNIYGMTVNGSLWTLPVEFLCYIMCFLFYVTGFLKQNRMKWTIPLAGCGTIFLYWILHNNELLQAALMPALFFYLGMCCWIYRESINLNRVYMWAGVIILVIAAWMQVLKLVSVFVLPYVLLFIAFGTKNKANTVRKDKKIPEISYSMYLCGWPIQSMVCMLFGGHMKAGTNFLISYPIVILAGYGINYLGGIVISYLKRKK